MLISQKWMEQHLALEDGNLIGAGCGNLALLVGEQNVLELLSAEADEEVLLPMAAN